MRPGTGRKPPTPWKDVASMANARTVVPKIAAKAVPRRPVSTSFGTLKRPVVPVPLHVHEVDGYLVTSTLSAGELAAMPERRRNGVLRKILGRTMNPRRTGDAA